MYFAQIRRLSQRLSVRLAFLFSLLFFVSALASFGVLYFLLSNQLKRYDRSIIEAKWKEFSEVYKYSGLEGLTALIAKERSREGDIPLLVQVLDSSGKTIFLKVPEDSTRLRPEIEKMLEPASLQNEWGEINSPHEDDKIDFRTEPLANGGQFLRVGKSSDPRDDLLESLISAFFAVCALFVALGAGLGIFFSNRALSPLRSLLSTMKKVRKGSLSSRVPLLSTGDEMEQLSAIFNQMLDRVERLVTGMRETLDNVAHDIRTPMARIRATAEMRLKDPAGPLDREALEDCAENADEVVSILNSLLDLAEAESGSIQLKKEPTNFSSLVKPVIDLYEIVAEEKSVRVSIEKKIDPVVSVDRSRIKQALGNLLDNAIKYSPGGSEVVFSAEEFPDRVLISVKDSGEGINADDLPRIWERLFRADRSRSQKGMGIGLSIVRAIVRAHGGDATVVSEPGRGSTFYLSLPR